MKVLRSRIRFLAVVLTLLFFLALIAGTGVVLQGKKADSGVSAPELVETASPSPDGTLPSPSDETSSPSPDEPEYDTFGL